MILRPSKHSHPDRTVISVSYLLIRYLKQKRVCDYDDLLKYAKKSVVGGNVLFLPALNFLYLMGVVDYRPKNDVIEYVGPNK